jgi:hypothetical protein
MIMVGVWVGCAVAVGVGSTVSAGCGVTDGSAVGQRLVGLPGSGHQIRLWQIDGSQTQPIPHATVRTTDKAVGEGMAGTVMLFLLGGSNGRNQRRPGTGAARRRFQVLSFLQA